MAKRKTTKKTTQTNIHFSQISPETQNIFIGIFLIIIALLAFFSTQKIDTTGEVPIIGQYLHDGLSWLFGEYFRAIFAPILAGLGILILIKKTIWTPVKLIWILLFYLSLCSLIGWYDTQYKAFFNVFSDISKIIGPASSLIAFTVGFFLSLWLVFQFSYKKILMKAKENVVQMATTIKMPDLTVVEEKEEGRLKISTQKIKITEELEEVRGKMQNQEKLAEKEEEKKEKPKKIFPIFTEKNTTKIDITDTEGNVISRKEPIKLTKNQNQNTKWDFPSSQLLNKGYKKNPISPEEIKEKALIIQKTLLQFGIEVEMEQECVGPTVIQYRVRPAEWVRVSRIENLKKDLALALSAKSIRIQAPIPGMNLVGIEVPNDKRDIVWIREVIESSAFTNAKSPLALTMGKDINGNYIVGDLAKMPHLLIAGQTGSGKSVGMNSFIISMLYKNSPYDLRMIMIDPKQVELGMYDGIPHLLTPVINSPDKALNILRWCVAEMERRYSMLKGKSRNLNEWNERYPEEKMPCIVIIVDELADLMMMKGNKKEVESNITRIAQKARAVGMHLILATQRPSVDVITGIIKANVPSRVAFTVASQIDSRTILDQGGAEDLLGYGDMMYFPTGSMSPTRVQGVLVETEEVENVVRHIRLVIPEGDFPPTLTETDINGSGNDAGSIMEWNNFNEDPQVIENAIAIIREAGKGSTSLLQRRMNVGYGRAAKILDILEMQGIVGPANGSKPRDVIG